MSVLLESLLGSARRRECEANDAALKESSMKHGCDKPARRYADSLAEPGEFEFTVLRYGKPEAIVTEHCDSDLAASMRAIELFGPGAVVTINRAGRGWLEQTMRGVA